MSSGLHAVHPLRGRAHELSQEVFILKCREDKRLLPLIHALASQGVVIPLATRPYLHEQSDRSVHQGSPARVKTARSSQAHDLPHRNSVHHPLFFLYLHARP
ncbi:RNA methyltransferase substrate-binding domain-containing protein, partial [Salmonella enterica]|uniref:RNA methyltransferase substrate-binding domain-containing protein n=1 Tax=Salmonella enterica TaxID=28901 RepID=UPI00398C6998